MQLDRASLGRLAAQESFRPDVLEKVIRLGAFLEDLGRQPLLKQALVLKGGTALNLCFGRPARLSVDLDFNYVRHDQRERMLEDRPRTERALARLAEAGGYRVQLGPDAHANRKMYLLYLNVGGTPDRIELDVNFLHRIPLSDACSTHCWQPGDYDEPEVRVVGIAEIAAGKLCALFDRVAPRDLFDAVRLPNLVGEVWGTDAFRQLFIGLAGTLPHPIHTYSQIDCMLGEGTGHSV